MRELRISGVLGVVQEPSAADGGGGVRFTFRYMVCVEPETTEKHIPVLDSLHTTHTLTYLHTHTHTLFYVSNVISFF